MKTDLVLKFKQNLFSKVIWSSTFNYSGGLMTSSWTWRFISMWYDDVIMFNSIDSIYDKSLHVQEPDYKQFTRFTIFQK